MAKYKAQEPYYPWEKPPYTNPDSPRFRNGMSAEAFYGLDQVRNQLETWKGMADPGRLRKFVLSCQNVLTYDDSGTHGWVDNLYYSVQLIDCPVVAGRFHKGTITGAGSGGAPDIALQQAEQDFEDNIR